MVSSGEQRKDRRATRSGLQVQIDRQTYPVLNFSAGGLLIGDAGVGFGQGKKLFLTLFHASNPSDKAFLYGHVVWLDSFRKVVGIDFMKPSEHSYRYLESMMSGSQRRPKPQPKPGLIKRLFG